MGTSNPPVVDPLSLIERSTPGVEVDKGKLYTKDVAGVTELFYIDPDVAPSSEVQITSGSGLNSGILVPPLALADLSDVTAKTGTGTTVVMSASPTLTGTLGIGIAPVAGTRLTLPQELDAATPTLAFGDGDSGFYESSDDDIRVSLAGAVHFAWIGTPSRFVATGGTRTPALVDEASSITNPVFTFENDFDTGVGTGAADQLSLIVGGVEAVRMVEAIGAISHTFTGILGIGIAPVTGTRLTLPQEADAVTPTLAFGDGDSGFYESSDDDIRVSIAGVVHWAWIGTPSRFVATGGTRTPALVDEASSITNPVFTFENDFDTGLGTGAADQLSLIAGGVEAMRIVEAAGNISNIFIGTTTFNAIAYTWPGADGGAADVLTTSGGGVLSWTTIPPGVTTFLGLSDTPGAFTTANAIYKVNAAGNAVEEATDFLLDASGNLLLGPDALAAEGQFSLGIDQDAATTVSISNDSGGVSATTGFICRMAGGRIGQLLLTSSPFTPIAGQEANMFHIDTGTITDGLICLNRDPTGVFKWKNSTTTHMILTAAGVLLIGAAAVSGATQQLLILNNQNADTLGTIENVNGTAASSASFQAKTGSSRVISMVAFSGAHSTRPNTAALSMNGMNTFFTSLFGASSNARIFQWEEGPAGDVLMELNRVTGLKVNQQLTAAAATPNIATFTGAANVAMTASAEAVDIDFDLARTVQFATGALATQRAMVIQAPTYAFVGASTITTAATVAITGAPIAGTNATITEAFALDVGGSINLTGTQGRVIAEKSLGGATLPAGTPAFTFDGRTTTGLGANNTSVRLINSGVVAIDIGASSITVDRATGFTGNVNCNSGHFRALQGTAAAPTYVFNDSLATSGFFQTADDTIAGSIAGVQVWNIIAGGDWTYAQGIRTTGSPTFATFTAAAHTTLTASTEAIDINFDLARTVQFATGALATQRAALFQAPTYGFVGASTITDAATVAITGAPVAGTNATLTNTFSLWVQAGLVKFAGTLEVGTPPTFTRNATVVEDRTLLASASATATNNNNVLAALIADFQTMGMLA